MASSQRKGGGKTVERTPLEVLKKILEPTKRDQFLKEANLGLGNYSNSLYYQQIEGFQNHLLGETLFGEGRNIRRAVDDVKHQLARAEWETMSVEERRDALELDEDESEGVRDRMSRREWFRERGTERWNELIEEGLEEYEDTDEREFRRLEKKLRVLEDRASVDGEFVDPFGRMILARHEASRSRDAHLIDSATGRVKEWKGDKKKKKRRIRGRRD